MHIAIVSACNLCNSAGNGPVACAGSHMDQVGRRHALTDSTCNIPGCLHRRAVLRDYYRFTGSGFTSSLLLRHMGNAPPISPEKLKACPET